MTVLLALAMASTLATRAAPQTPPCPGETTLAINQCFGDVLAGADADLARYVAAAKDRLRRETAQAAPDDTSTARALRGLEAAETAWSAYRDAACGAVYDYWSGGTIRNVEALACKITLTRLHTHTIWSQWLTYMDSTPPLLPEPPVPADE